LAFWGCALFALAAVIWTERGHAEPSDAGAFAPASNRALVTHRFDVQSEHGTAERVLAVWAPPASADEKLPVVIAFHGKGESVLGAARGYTAWLDRYQVDRAYRALLAPPLLASALGGLVRPAELATLNDELRVHPFRGVVVVGVYTPDLLVSANDPARLQRYAEWVARTLVPEVQKQVPVASTSPRQVGVDGVSLGGMVALEVGLRFPDVFGAVGAMQPAVRGREALLAALAERARSQLRQNVRLMSSDRDPLLPVTRALSAELRTRHVGHQLVITPGGHDYAFNRGPGAIELLRFHDRALRELSE